MADTDDAPNIALLSRDQNCESYGAAKEGIFIAGYALERAFMKVEFLLENDRWRTVGSFRDVNDFIRGLNLGDFHVMAEQRQRIAKRIKELQPTASNRAIGDMLGVAGRTIDRDVATNVAADEPKHQQNQSGVETSCATVGTNVAPDEPSPLPEDIDPAEAPPGYGDDEPPASRPLPGGNVDYKYRTPKPAEPKPAPLSAAPDDVTKILSIATSVRRWTTNQEIITLCDWVLNHAGRS
jgi:hypothetical protein